MRRFRRCDKSYENKGDYRAIKDNAGRRSALVVLTLDQHIGVRIPGGQPNQTYAVAVSPVCREFIAVLTISNSGC
jgi:hypothetical protein